MSLLAPRAERSAPVDRLSPAQERARERVLQSLRDGELVLEPVPCPGCGAAESTALASRDRYGLPTHAVACTSCSLLYTSPRLSDASLDLYHRRDAYEVDRGDFPRERYFDLERQKGDLIAAFLDESRASPAGRVLELGCGAGGVLAAFAERGHEVSGWDLEAEVVAEGARQGLDIRQGDERSLIAKLEAGGVGLVILEQVIEHLPDPRALLASLRPHFDDDALLYIGVPGYRNADRHYGSDFLRYLEIDHLVHFDLATLTRMAAQAGFKRVAGNEVVRAVFAPGHEQPDPGPLEDPVEFLRSMESRRRAAACRALPLRAARRVGRLVRRLWPHDRGSGRYLSSRAP